MLRCMQHIMTIYGVIAVEVIKIIQTTIASHLGIMHGTTLALLIPTLLLHLNSAPSSLLTDYNLSVISECRKKLL